MFWLGFRYSKCMCVCAYGPLLVEEEKLATPMPKLDFSLVQILHKMDERQEKDCLQLSISSKEPGMHFPVVGARHQTSQSSKIHCRRHDATIRHRNVMRHMTIKHRRCMLCHEAIKKLLCLDAKPCQDQKADTQQPKGKLSKGSFRGSPVPLKI